MVSTVAAPRRRGVHSLGVLAAAPLLVAFLGSLVVTGGWALGAAPFWPIVDVTVSEAAALKDAGEVVRLIVFEMHDPNRAWPVRDGILGARQDMTPLEAAVAIRRLEIVRVLLNHGAVPPAGERRTALICRAVELGALEIADFLVKSDGGPDPRARCVLPSSGSE